MGSSDDVRQELPPGGGRQHGSPQEVKKSGGRVMATKSRLNPQNTMETPEHTFFICWGNNTENVSPTGVGLKSGLFLL